ncbi:MAG: hypothetical protein BroJett018_48400 [Chloroflexota bacterium]|nr:hypothetical protein [Chloroflexota bacterium]GIK67046.1 MAG: hypothetical protein BroJett018_48400 [Chloroflexota bacterium]
MPTYQPVLYQASSPAAEYSGQIAAAFTQNLRADVIKPLLKRHGLENVDPAAWYPQQQILDILRDIEREFTFEELVAVGIKASELVPPPPMFHNIESVVQAANLLHQSACRNVQPDEGVFTEQIGERHYRLTFNLPSPPFAIYGVLYGLMRQVRKPNEDPRLVFIRRETPAVIEVRW